MGYESFSLIVSNFQQIAGLHSSFIKASVDSKLVSDFRYISFTITENDYRGRFTNTSADIWSLGIIMYEMIYKNLPFKVGKDGLILRKDIELFFKEEK